MLRPKTMPYAAGLAALIALAGCAGGDGEGTTPSASLVAETTPATSTVTTSSAAPTSAEPNFPPGLPDAAKEHTKAGARAFVRELLNRVNSSWTEADPGYLKGLCGSTAAACDAWSDEASRLNRSAQRYEGNPVTIGRLESLKPAGGSQRVLSFLTQERRNIVDARGNVQKTDTRKELTFIATVSWTASGWQLAGFDKVSGR